MNGYLVIYRPDNSNSRTKVNHLLFGRLVYKNYRGRKYTYYVKGMLHNVRFVRITGSKIFVESINTIDMVLLSPYCNMDMLPCLRDVTNERFVTAREHWEGIYKENGIALRNKNDIESTE